MDNQLFKQGSDLRPAFDDVKTGYAVIRQVSVELSKPSLEERKDSVIGEARHRLNGAVLSEQPRIKVFRDCYRRFGVDPKSRHPSAEALLRRILDPTKGLYRVNTVVDAYNLASIRFQLPMAAYDLDRISLPIVIRLSQEGELFRGIGESTDARLKDGELVYADQERVLCRDYNYRDADHTKITSGTRSVILFTDGCADITAGDVRDALRAAVEMVIEFNGGTVDEQGVLSATG